MPKLDCDWQCEELHGTSCVLLLHQSWSSVSTPETKTQTKKKPTKRAHLGADRKHICGYVGSCLLHSQFHSFAHSTALQHESQQFFCLHIHCGGFFFLWCNSSTQTHKPWFLLRYHTYQKPGWGNSVGILIMQRVLAVFPGLHLCFK